MKVIPKETKPLYWCPKRIEMTPMKDEEQAQQMPSMMPPAPFRTRQPSNMLTPFTSDAPPLRAPPLRMRPRPKPADIVDFLPNDIDRLSLPILSAHDLTNNPIKAPPLPLNIVKRRRRPSEERTPSACGKRTRPTDNPVWKSATFQYPGISGRTIYADPITGATEVNDEDIVTTCSEKNLIEEEDFYFPMPRFTPATRSALSHVLQLSK